MSFHVTKYWIEQNCTLRGAWTAAQLRLIGVSWPPVAGWKDRAVGLEISDDAKAEFEARGHHGRRLMRDNWTIDKAFQSALERDTK